MQNLNPIHQSPEELQANATRQTTAAVQMANQHLEEIKQTARNQPTRQDAQDIAGKLDTLTQVTQQNNPDMVVSKLEELKIENSKHMNEVSANIKEAVKVNRPQHDMANAFLSLLKGEKGDSPTKEEIVSLVKPLLPDLIPKPIPGKDADEEKIIQRVIAQIPKPKDGKDGKSVIEGQIIQRVLEKIPVPKDGKDGEKGGDGSPDTGEQIVEKLNPLENVLDFKILRNIPDFVTHNQLPHSGGGGGGTNLNFRNSTGGVISALVTDLQFGSGITPTYSGGKITLTASGGGSGTFIGLTDVPASYAGQALKVVSVNAGETALVFTTLAGGGDALTANPLSQFASTTSLQLKGVISDETGSGALVFATSPTLVTPVLGVASATSINKVILTAPATGSTLTIIDGKTLTVNNTMSFAAADDTGVYTLPTGNKTLLATDGAGTSLTGIPYTLTGTANQVVLSAGTGNITFSLPQNIATSSTPQFAAIELGAASDTTLSRVSAGVIAVEGVTILTTATGQPLDADLTTIAGLTATTDNFIVSVASAWASRTPAQVRTTLALVIGTNVQAWDADLDTWATKTAPSGTVVGTSDSQVLTTKTMIATSNVVEEATTTASSSTPTPTGGSLRNFFTITALAAAPTFAAPSGSPADGNYLTIRIKDNGTARALAWNAIYRGSTDQALPTTTTLSKTMYIGFRYNSADSKWDCLSVNNGF